MSICVKCPKQQGMILVSTLLFLFVITFLVMISIENTILEIKMAMHFANNSQAFENAESLLAIGKSAMNGQYSQGQASFDALGDYTFKLVSSDCDYAYYQLDANGVCLNARVQLQSSIRLTKSINCQGQPQTPAKYRLYWMKE